MTVDINRSPEIFAYLSHGNLFRVKFTVNVFKIRGHHINPRRKVENLPEKNSGKQSETFETVKVLSGSAIDIPTMVVKQMKTASESPKYA